jgi:hypothetical protein
MDRLTAFVAVAHLKLRLEILQRHPEYLEMAPTIPTIPAPIQLAGLKSRLQRAKLLEGRSAIAGGRFDAALDGIDTAIGAVEKHAGQLEQYGNDLLSTIAGMIEPSNGGPPLEGTPAADPTPPPTPPLGPNGGPRIL